MSKKDIAKAAVSKDVTIDEIADALHDSSYQGSHPITEADEAYAKACGPASTRLKK